MSAAAKGKRPRSPSTGTDKAGAGGDGAGSDDAKATRSATRATVDGETAPRLPHERDESSDSGTGAPSDLMRQAHDDVESGKSGTDRGEATDAVYAKTLRGATPGRDRDKGGK